MADESRPASSRRPNGADASVPHSARIWNYWLGGKDNYGIDREVGDQIAQMNPQIVEIAQVQRAFLRHTVRYLAGEAGIRQFLDIGTGLPTAENTHEVAQRVVPQARIVYVDNDPLVLVYARALLASCPEGACDYIDADLKDPDKILQSAAATLDLAAPTALMLLGITAHIVDDDTAYAVVDRLMAALPVGSYLVLSDATEVVNPEAMRQMVDLWNQESENPRKNRSPQQIARFFDGLELVEPGLVLVTRWHSEEATRDVDSFGGVGRKAV